jgi:DNA polymerase-3 subunit delta'
MLFAEIIAQHDIKKRLIQTVTDQRIPHAQLFRGPEGIGKLGLAIAYAQYISCENRTEIDSCGICPSCVKYNKLAHPDLHFVFPVIKPAGKSTVVCDDFIAEFRQMVLQNPYFSINDWYLKISGDAKQGLIYSNESDEIIRKLSLKTYESEYKVMIIWLPEKMHQACANKLLKILEEPPEKTIFLLVSDSPDEVLGTILSRTQHLNIPQLAENDIVLTLLQNPRIDITQDDALNIARTANGSYINALSALNEGDESKLNFDRFVSIMRMAWQVGNKKDYASLKSLRKWADDMAPASIGRERQKNFLKYAQRMTRESFIRNIEQPRLNYMTSFETDFTNRFSPFINERNVEELTSEFALAERQIEQNANAKMVFFDLTLKIIMLLKK